MPLLASLLGNAFSSTVGFFAAFFTKKAAVGTALALFLIAGWIALQVALLALWSSIGYTVPESMHGALAVVLYLLPDHTAVCVEAIVLAKVGRWLWDRQREWAAVVAAA